MDRMWGDVPQLIVDAYRLKDARGVELLEELGAFSLWSGNLAEMRNDRGDKREVGIQSLPADVERFGQIIAVRKALDLIAPRCAEAVHLHYLQNQDGATVARKLQTTSGYADNLITSCTTRLLEIASDILSASVPAAQAASVPDLTSSRSQK